MRGILENKKGVSDVVITVSMILISIVAVGVVSSFVVPMIKKQLSKSTSCLALREHYKIRTDLTATCFNATAVKLVVQRGSEKEDSKGFILAVYTTSGEAVPFTATNETTGLPQKGGAKSYIVPITPGAGQVERVTIFTVLPNEEGCDERDYSGISKC
jgi:hypothetical protein